MNIIKLSEVPADLDYSDWDKLVEYVDLYLGRRKLADTGMAKKSVTPQDRSTREHLIAVCENRLLRLMHHTQKVSPDNLKKIIEKLEETKLSATDTISERLSKAELKSRGSVPPALLPLKP